MTGISGLSAYYSFPGGGSYGGSYGIAAAVRNAQNMGQISPIGYGAKKAASPDTPVEQVRPVPIVRTDAPSPIGHTVPSWNLNAADEAVRMRIQYAENMPQDNASRANALLKNVGAESPMNMPVSAWEGIPTYPGMDAAEAAVRLRIQYPGAEEEAAESGEPVGAEGVQKAVEDGKCETCEQRKYQDGSDDMSVSYQTPTRIAPENVASAVRGHEMEHVSHEQVKAQQEGRKVVSQSVTLHTDICPECGKTYISGGTTRTVTAAKTEQPTPETEPDSAKAPAGIA